MNTIVNVKQAITISNTLKQEGQKIILAGGCFDILHRGHIEFLEKSKAQDGILMIFIESDEKVKLLKGNTRPINSQKDRAFILSKLSMVDYIILLPYFKHDQDYFTLVKKINPDIITITYSDTKQALKAQQALIVNGKLVAVVKNKKQYSTTDILKRLSQK